MAENIVQGKARRAFDEELQAAGVASDQQPTPMMRWVICFIDITEDSIVDHEVVDGLRSVLPVVTRFMQRLSADPSIAADAAVFVVSEHALKNFAEGLGVTVPEIEG